MDVPEEGYEAMKNMLKQSTPEGLHPCNGPVLEQSVKNPSLREELTLEKLVKDCRRDPMLQQGKSGRKKEWYRQCL